MSKDLITQNYLSLTPAIYSKPNDYKNAKDAVAAFKAGKDFYANGVPRSGYVSISEFAVGTIVKIRYNRIERTVMYTVKASDHKPESKPTSEQVA